MNQGGINAPLTGIKLPTIGWVVVALVNWAMANIGEKHENPYLSTYIVLAQNLLRILLMII